MGYAWLPVVATVVVQHLFVARASFCGRSAIPFSFEVLSSGRTVLGCARPTCFGWTADRKPYSSDAQFYRIEQETDGFLRKSSVKPEISKRARESGDFQPQIAECEPSYSSPSCAGSTEWVGGIAVATNASTQPIALQCCTYEALRGSSDRGVAVVEKGQLVIGGEVQNRGRQYAFDYIADVLKHTAANGNTSYDVSVRRFMCLPYPSEDSLVVDSDAKSTIVKHFGGSTRNVVAVARGAKGRAYHAPIAEAGASVDGSAGYAVPYGPSPNAYAAPQPSNAYAGTYQVSSSNVQTAYAEEGYELPPGQAPVIVQSQQQPQYYQVPNFGGYQGYGGGSSCVPCASPAAAPTCCAAGGFGGGGAGFGHGLFCFSGDTIVKTHSGVLKRLDELTLDHWVMSVKNNQVVYSSIEAWMHRLPEQKAEFIKITLTDGTSLKLTGKHYIYKSACNDTMNGREFDETTTTAVWAEKVETGDCLYRLTEDEKSFKRMEVVSIAKVIERGIYAPMTSTGDIVVNGVLASCHNVVNSQSLQKTFFSMVSSLRKSSEWLFGAEDSESLVSLPMGIDILTTMIEAALPSQIHSL